MRSITAVLAAALAAAPAFASDWAPQADAEQFAAIAAPAAPVPLKAAPRDGTNYSAAEEMLVKEFGITAISMNIPEAEVMRQDRAYDNAFCFDHAFRLALNDFLENYTTPSSALSATLRGMGAANAPSKAQLKKARQKLLALMNDPASEIALARLSGFPRPPNGEKLKDNWIFQLSLGGRPYWAIVDRSGVKETYNYGE